jgi:hypothetical protein
MSLKKWTDFGHNDSWIEEIFSLKMHAKLVWYAVILECCLYLKAMINNFSHILIY